MALRGIRIIAFLALVGVAAVATWQVDRHVDPDTTTLGLLLVALIAITAAMYPRAFLALGRRVTHLDAFGITIELRVENAKRAIRRFETEEDGLRVTTPEWPESTRQAVGKVAHELRRKLRFSSEALLGDAAGISEEFIVIRLGLEGLLESDESSLCLELLDGLREDLSELDRDDRDEFLDEAWVFAVRFASRMFDRQVRRRLAANGWSLADFSQGKGHRADFLATRNGASALLAARVAAPRDGVFRTRNRLANVDLQLPGVGRLVVVPDHVAHLWPALDEQPMTLGNGVIVVRIGRLVAEPEIVLRDEDGLALAPEPEEA